jgi:alginate O-acetyltransferase complex protein AlgI
MAFGTWVAGSFVIATFAAYWLAPARWRVPILIVASYVFYAWAFPPHAFLLAALTIATWWIGRGVASSASRRSWLVAGVTFTLVVLALFKYASMAVTTFNALSTRVNWLRLPLPAIAAPLGISFVTFALIHYLVEVYRGTPPLPLGEFLLYPAFFPTIVAGPIKRYPQFAEDIASVARPLDWNEVSYGIGRIIIGLAKKLIIADTVANLVGPLLNPARSAPFMVLVAIYAYAIQIYFDFAGYSDIAIGSARLFGFRILENFNWPYLRRNLAEFWSHWHISLTRFITEYVFIPLGGSRRGRLRTALNTLIAMTLSGLWHGAAWHFVAWGLWHGVGLVTVRWWRESLGWLRHRLGWFNRIVRHPFSHGVGYALGVLVTFNYVALGWVLFATSLKAAPVVYSKAWEAVVTIADKVMGRLA